MACFHTLMPVAALAALLIGPSIAFGADDASADVQSPEAYLQRPIAADFQLADWPQVSGYYRQLAEQSPCVDLLEVGQTTEGRDFLAAVISSPENLDNLDAIQAASKIIADPRGATSEERDEAIRDGRVVLFITPSMHSNEVAATEMGMQLSWQLATSGEEPWQSMRREAVVVILPSLNPDGVDRVAQWYDRNLGKPYESTSLPELYQKYSGHDNNRDWFALTQAESRLLTRMLYHQWHPQILWDVHQMGSTRQRFFVPPYRDPLNDNIDPMIVAGMNVIGSRAAMDMTGDGCSGVATGVGYDNWWNGGNRSVPARHNIIGILTEAASTNLASPMFISRSSLRDPLGRDDYSRSNRFIDPWPGGWWRPADIARYELSFARSLFGTITREPKFWLENKLDAAAKASTLGEAPERSGWLITKDNPDLGAVERILDVLQLGGVEVHISRESFEADGREYPGGTIVVRCDQPNRNYVNDLFELQEFPDGERPYDVTGWTLPALFGLRSVEVIHPFDADLEKLPPDADLPSAFADPEAKDEQLETLDSRDWQKLISRIQDDASESGTQLPRVGVYAPWNASIDEGWLRWTLESMEVPYVRLRNEMIRAGGLKDDFDVIILPNVSTSQLNSGRSEGTVEPALAGGLDVEGAVAIEEFIRAGGKLIAVDNACPWVIDLFRIPLADVTKEKAGRDFSCSGSVLRGTTEECDVTRGLPPTIPLMFSNSTAWRELDSAEQKKGDYAECTITPLLRYAPRRLLLSGFIEDPEVIENQLAWLRVGYGDGEIQLFGFTPYYRGWSHATFHLLARAIVADQ